MEFFMPKWTSDKDHDYSRVLPRPLVVPGVMTVRTLEDVRKFIKHLRMENTDASFALIALVNRAARRNDAPTEVASALASVVAMVERVLDIDGLSKTLHVDELSPEVQEKLRAEFRRSGNLRQAVRDVVGLTDEGLTRASELQEYLDSAVKSGAMTKKQAETITDSLAAGYLPSAAWGTAFGAFTGSALAAATSIDGKVERGEIKLTEAGTELTALANDVKFSHRRDSEGEHHAMTSAKTEGKSEDLKAIAREEVARRKTLLEAALAMFKPVIEIAQVAREHGTNFSLNLRPPETGTNSVTGTLWWRAFHPHPEDDYYYYDIVMWPERGSCWIGARVVMSEEDRDRYRCWNEEYPDPEWSDEYFEKISPSLNDLRELLKEALISELAEKLGGPLTFRV